MSEILAEVFVPGRPRPKGSMRCMGANHHMAEDNPESKPWRRQMAYALTADRDRRWPNAHDRGPYPWEVDVSIIAFFPVDGPKPGDVDKLARNVLDALQDSAGYASPPVLVDDAQVVGLLSERTVCAGAEQGVWIRVSTVAPEEWRRRQMLREAARGAFLAAAGYAEATGF